MTKDKALDLALEALQFDGFMPEDLTHRSLHAKAITAIKQALAAPVQEPVARQYQGRDGVWKDFISEKHYKDTLEDGSWPIRALYTTPPAAPVQEPLTWYEGAPPFPQDQEWFIAETIYGDRVVLRSLDEGREHKGNYAFKTADQTYMKQEIVKRWMQFPDCEYLPPAQPAPVPLTDEQAHQILLDMAKHIETFGPEDITEQQLSAECVRFICQRVAAHGITKGQPILEQALAAPVQEPVAGCACRWNEEGDRTVTCERHQGWLEVIAEWAERAREAEAKLKATPPAQQQSESAYQRGYMDGVAKQRQWQSLTDDEVIKCTPTWGGTVEAVARAIEAKLRSKNT